MGYYAEGDKINVGTIGHVDYGENRKVSVICMDHVTGATIAAMMSSKGERRSKGDRKGGRKTRWDK